MKTKSKVISRVIAVFLALVMVFTSSVYAFAAGYGNNRADKATTLGKNWVDWVDTLNEDACEALLDAADEWLKDLDLTYLASTGQYSETQTLPINMDLKDMLGNMGGIYGTIAGLMSSNSYARVYLGNQKNPNGKYYTGTGQSPTESTTAPGRNRVYLNVWARVGGSLIGVTKSVSAIGYVDSVDGIIDLLCQIYNNVLTYDWSALSYDLLDTVGGAQVKRLATSLSILGTGSGKLYNASYYDTSNITHTACGKSWRKKIGAKETIKWIARVLDALIEDNDENNLIYSALSGTLALGALNDTVGLYYKPGDDKTAQQARDDGIIGGLLTGDKAPIWDQYETGGWLLYNGLAAWVMNNQLPTTDNGRSAYYGDGANIVLPSSGALTGGTYNGEAWNYDKVILDCITRNVIDLINVDVTYPEYIQNEDGKWVHDSSVARFKRGAEAYDPNLKINADGNVYIFQYGNEKLTLGVNDNLYSFAMRALKLAWKTCLKPTLHLLQINYNGHESDGNGTNFDNGFLQWYIENKATGDVRSFDADDAYTQATVDEWAADVCDDYNVDAATFIANVKKTYDYDEARKAANKYYNWRDIEVTSLWNQVRYSPLADKVFGLRTGPANLYFLQTGCSNIDAFMDDAATYTNYAGIPEALNDFLIAAVQDLFPNSANIGYNNAATGEFENIAVPSGFMESTTFNAGTIMDNIYKVLEYVGNTTNANIFNPYYAANAITYDGSTVNLNHTNIEEALIPFAISALKQWNMTATIHNSDWDKVDSLETGAIVALQEYLGYLFPDRDYSTLWTLEERQVPNTDVSYKYIVAKSGEDLYEDVIFWMARDAAAYAVVATGTPMTKLDNAKTPWDPYTMSALNTKTADSNIFALANSVGCYFLASGETFDTAGTSAKSKGIGALLGLKSAISSSNSLWTNLDAIFNRVLPVFGEFQYYNGAYKNNGAFSSQNFLEDTIIPDVLEFNLSDLLDGVYRILSAAPIKTKHVNKVLYYDILAPVLNSILGVNPSNSGSAALIPTADSATPFDVFLKPDNIRGTNYINGIIPRLFHNLYLFFYGGGAETDFYNSVTFLLCTLGVPGQLKETDIGGVKISVYDTDLYSTSPVTTIKVRNDSYGLNRFFHNQGDLNAARQYEASRYWVSVKNVQIQNAAGSKIKDISTATTSLAPEKNVYFKNQTWTATRGTLYKVVVTYDILFDDTLTNGTASTAAAASTVRYANQVASKWIYVPPTGYTQTWQHQADGTFDGAGFKEKDGTIIGQVTTGTAAGGVTLRAGQMYDVPASDVAGPGYGVQLTANAAKTGRMYVYPVGLNALDVDQESDATFDGSDYAFVYSDWEGNILDADGNKLYTFEEAVDEGFVVGCIKTENEEREEVFNGVIADYASIPEDVAFGAPGASVKISDVTELEAETKSVKLFDKGWAYEGKFTVGIAFDGTATATVSPVTIAYMGDMDALNTALENYADFTSGSAERQAGAKAACIRYRNSTNIDGWTNADHLRRAIEDACADEAATRAETITNMSEGADDLDEVDYKIVGFKRYKKYVEKAENLREAKPIVVEEDGEPVLDNDRNEIPVLDEKGRPTYTYKAAAPTWKINEFVRVANLYETYMEERAHTLDRVTEELAHATSPCDDYDALGNTQYGINDFSAAATTADRNYVVTDENGVPVLTGAVTDKLDDRGYQYDSGAVDEYRFAYTTKGKTEADNVKVYDISTSLADGTEVKFGKIAGGKLVNDGYTTDSWNAYVDALGEVITSINNSEPISKTYTATTHLVMAENELEPAETDGITISGKVVIANTIGGGASNYGARGVYFKVNGEYLTDENDARIVTSSETGHFGEFTITLPAGTTEFQVVPGLSERMARTVTVNAACDDAVIPVHYADYNNDSFCNGLDMALFKGYMKNYNYYGDYNNDGFCNGLDMALFKGYYNKTLTYDTAIVLE